MVRNTPFPLSASLHQRGTSPARWYHCTFLLISFSNFSAPLAAVLAPPYVFKLSHL